MNDLKKASLPILSSRREAAIIFLLAAVQFSHILDFVILMPLGPILMEDLSIGPAQFAGLVSSYNISAGVAGVFYGLIADRFNRKRLLIIFMIGFIIGTGLCSFAPNFHYLLIARVMAGIFGGIINGVVLAIVTDIVPYDRRGKAMGVIMSAFSVSSVIGVPTGLILADHFGWRSTFIFIAGFSLIVLLVSLKYIPSIRASQKEGGVLFALRKYGSILSNRTYVKAQAFIFMTSLSIFALIPFLSPYAVKNIGIQTVELKYMYFCGGILTIFTSRMFGVLTDKLGALKVFIVVSMIACIPIYFYSHAETMGLVRFVMMGAFFMSFVSGRMIPCVTMLSGIPKEEDRGSFMGILGSIRSLGAATATLLAGFIITEGEGGVIENFDTVGVLSIIVVLSILPFSFAMKPSVKN